MLVCPVAPMWKCPPKKEIHVAGSEGPHRQPGSTDHVIPDYPLRKVERMNGDVAIICETVH
jgi:hypothetical protein